MENIFIQIERLYHDVNYTLGNCTIYKEVNDPWGYIPLFTCVSLERGWHNNEPNISCIPVGKYDCVLEHSPKFNKQLWEIYGVEGRTETKFHSANYWHELNGCIALGTQTLFLDSDKEYDVTNSKRTMDLFHEVLRPMNGKIVKLIVK
jgi:hypothetical protein